MDPLTIYEIAGAWIGIFLTLSVLSFLYDDNPIYKMTEHLFMGVSIGYGVSESFWNVLKPNMFDKLGVSGEAEDPEFLYIIPLILCIMLMFKATKKYGWVARIPIAILVSAYAAVKVTGEATGKLIIQLKDSIPNMSALWNEYGFWTWSEDGAGVFSATFLVLGLMASLIHFYFSEIPEKAQKWGIPLGGIIFILTFLGCVLWLPVSTGGKITIGICLALCAGAPFLTLSPYKPQLTRFGILVLMLSFGASFGFTVMGRISLAIGRAQHLMGNDLPPAEAAQIHPQLVSLTSLTLIILFLIVWKKMTSAETAEEK